MEKANIRFYKVKKCGLYKPLARNATLGSFKEISNNIFNWSKAKNRLIQSTCTYEVNDDFDMNFLETYLMSMKQSESNNDYILTTWNRTHESGDAVYALDPSTITDTLSEKAFHKGNLPPTSIPGFATYFWLIPSIDSLATITFGSPRNGMEAFSYWLESFISFESKYCRFNKNKTKIKGYAVGENNPDAELEPRFVKFLHKNPAKTDLIIKHHRKIRKIIKRVKLDRAQLVHLGAIDSLSKILGLKEHTEIANSELPLTYELAYSPNKEQIKEIINNFESDKSTTGWEDVGFIFPENNSVGLNKKEWLSKSYAKTSIQLDIDWVIPGQLINLEKLVSTIQSRRTDLISHLVA